MPIDPINTLVYRRARFATRLPVDRRYSASHFWLLEVAPSRWRIGFTKFATRMLGDLVELNFSLVDGDPIVLGQPMGTIEGFKAVADLYGVASGVFVGGNAAVYNDPTLVDSDPYDRGWLYEIDGVPDPGAVSAQDYAVRLDTIIDQLLQRTNFQAGDDTCSQQNMS